MFNEAEYRTFEPFRNKHFPFLYCIDDPLLAKAAARQVTSAGPFGLETGFGEEPTRVWQFDNTIPWILTESNPASYRNFIADINLRWSDVDPKDVSLTTKLFALNTSTDRSLWERANILVWRNIHHGSMEIPTYKQLRTGQRLVFIINAGHESEYDFYESFLTKSGYNTSLLVQRPKTNPSLSRRFSFYKAEYVLDITKK